MGPRSENRGYVVASCRAVSFSRRLQWVHGPRTVVMSIDPTWTVPQNQLQWVHGPRTVVMQDVSVVLRSCTSFNGSTVREPWLW